MGKSSKPTIGYWHKMTLYMGHLLGAADALHKIESTGEVVWEGTHTGSGDIVIDQPELFGGEQGEGGIRGTLSVRMGEPGQMPHPLLVAMRPGPWPAARGLTTSVFDGDVGAMTKRVNPWEFVWSRYVEGWDQDSVWQPALAKIGDGMNPAHIIYQVLTDTRAGYGGRPAEVLREDNLLALANLMVAESLGLCLAFRTGTSVGQMLTTVCEHIGAAWGVDHLGRVVVTPYRGDYDINELPLLDESNIIAVEEFTEPQIDGGVNEVTVVGADPDTGKEIVRTYTNLAAVQAQGRVVAEKRQMPGLWNEELVARVAARECHALTSYPKRGKISVKASAGPFVRGEVRAFSWARLGIERMAVRIEDIDEGDAIDTRVHMTVLQDVAGMTQTSYLGDTGSSWTPPTAPRTRSIPSTCTRRRTATWPASCRRPNWSAWRPRPASWWRWGRARRGRHMASGCSLVPPARRSKRWAAVISAPAACCPWRWSPTPPALCWPATAASAWWASERNASSAASSTAA